MPPAGTLAALYAANGSVPSGRVRVPVKYRSRMRPALSGPKPTASVTPGAGEWVTSPSSSPGPSGAPVSLMSKKSALKAATVRRPSPGSCLAASSETVARSDTASDR